MIFPRIGQIAMPKTPKTNMYIEAPEPFPCPNKKFSHVPFCISIIGSNNLSVNAPPKKYPMGIVKN